MNKIVRITEYVVTDGEKIYVDETIPAALLYEKINENEKLLAVAKAAKAYVDYHERPLSEVDYDRDATVLLYPNLVAALAALKKEK